MTERALDDPLVVEGLAAQLYAQSMPFFFTWWHVTAEDVKERFRKEARKRIELFQEKAPF